MGLRSGGCIHLDEWVHHRLIACSEMPFPAAARQINTALKQMLQRQPTFLGELQWLFEVADRSNSGVLSLEDVVEVYSSGLWRLRACSEGPSQLSDAELESGDPDMFARHIVDAVDLDGRRDTVNYPELAAYCLGQRKQLVTLHMYDLSDGLARTVSPWLLGQQMGGIWHTGIVVQGREYYFSGDIYHDEPGGTRFGSPTKRIPLGFTLCLPSELRSFLVHVIRPEFTRQAYSVLHHNCNHFTDRVSMHLIGRHIPEEVLRLPEAAANAPAMLQPLLSRWFDSVEATARMAVSSKAGEKPRAAASRTSELRSRGDDRTLAEGTVVSVLPRRGEPGPAWLAMVCSAPGHGDPSVASAAGREWVRYFEPPGPGHCGEVRTELAERARLAPMEGRTGNIGATVYQAALHALESGQHGLAGGAPGGDGSSTWATGVAVGQLLAKGFEARHAEAALAHSGGDVERAAAFLQAHGVQPHRPPAVLGPGALPARPAAAKTLGEEADSRCSSFGCRPSRIAGLPGRRFGGA